MCVCVLCGGYLEQQQRCGVICVGGAWNTNKGVVWVCVGGGCLEHQQRCGLGVCGGGVIGATSRVELNLGV